MLARAQKKGLVDVQTHNIRDWAEDKHQITDDRPFGGGPGMVMKPEPLSAAIQACKKENSCVVYLCPDGELLNTPMARDLASKEHLVLVSGHYEGVDQRVRDLWVDKEVSIGDYVLTNGTLPAAVLMDAIIRYVPGVLGEEKSLTQDAFNDNLLSFPQYTRPVEFEGLSVPEVLLSGNHKAISEWRKEQQIIKTRQRRKDLLEENKS